MWPVLIRPRLAGFEVTGDKIDNNLVENAIRPTAIGKKNWLFIGDADAGQRSAIIYTVIENCRRRGLDPFAYLREVLTRLPNMTNHQVQRSRQRLGPRPASNCDGKLHHKRHIVNGMTLMTRSS